MKDYTAVSVISDCFDDNAKLRQMARYSSFLKLPVFYHGVPSYSSVMASGALIDTLDASEDRPSIVVVNVAPRHGTGKLFENGTPFAVFWYKNSMIVTTVADYTLGLVKKLKLTDSVGILELTENVDELISAGYLPAEKREQVIKTQFRSFDYVPRLVAYLAQKGIGNLKKTDYLIDQIQDEKSLIWFIDNFGNVKTNILPAEINFKSGDTIKTKLGEFTMYDRLKDVPEGKKAMIVGSSGLGQDRFIELVIQGKSLAKELNLEIGQEII